MSRIDGFLSREVIIALKGEEVARYPLHIIKPIGFEANSLANFPIAKKSLKMTDYELIPFSSEIPFICYIDSTLKVTESEKGCFILSI